MKSSKGFVHIVAPIVLLVALGVIVYLVILNNRTSTQNTTAASNNQTESTERSQNKSSEQNPKERAEEPFRLVGKATNKPDTDIYEGYVILEGVYQHESGANVHGGDNVSFLVDASYRSKLPIKNGERAHLFRFENYNLAKNELVKTSECGKAKIAIEGYDALLADIGGNDTSTLVKVYNNTSTTCPTSYE